MQSSVCSLLNSPFGRSHYFLDKLLPFCAKNDNFESSFSESFFSTNLWFRKECFCLTDLIGMVRSSFTVSSSKAILRSKRIQRKFQKECNKQIFEIILDEQVLLFQSIFRLEWHQQQVGRPTVATSIMNTAIDVSSHPSTNIDLSRYL